MKKRIFAVVLAVLMILSATPLAVFAVEPASIDPAMNYGDTVYFEITKADIDGYFGESAPMYYALAGTYYFASIKEAADYIQQVKDSFGMSDEKFPVTIRLLDNAYPDACYPQAWVKDLNAGSYKVGSNGLDCAFGFNAFNFTNGDKALIEQFFTALNIDGMGLFDVLDLNDVDLSEDELQGALNAAFGDDNAKKGRVAEILAEVSEYFYWDCDFVVTFDQTVENGEVSIAGQYDLYDDAWVPVSSGLEANEPLRLLSSVGGAFPYQAILLLKTFNCGVVDDWDDSALGKTMTVELRMYETSRGDNAQGGNYGLDYETGTSAVMATYTYTFSNVDLSEQEQTATEELTGNTAVTEVVTHLEDAIKTDNSIIARAAAQANEKEANSGDAFTSGDTDVSTETKIEVKLETVKVDTQSVVSAQVPTDVKVNTAVYDVKPIATVTTTITTTEGTKTITETVELTDEDLNGNPVTVRLAVPSTSAKVARITHKSVKYDTEEFYASVQGYAPNQYVEIQMTHFSEVDVETLTATTEESHKMGRQYKIVGGAPDANGVGRAIIPLSADELTAIGTNNLTVYGGEGDKRTTFTIDCAYTYFFNDGAKVEASSYENCAAFLIIDKDGSGNDISGYGYYEFYKGEKNKDNFLFYALFNAPANAPAND